MAIGQQQSGIRCSPASSSSAASVAPFRAVKREREPERVQKRASIAIVEPRETNLRLLSAILGRGYDVITSRPTRASEAVGTIQRERPDVVIIDIDPRNKKDDLEAVRQMRRSSPRTIIILYTTSTRFFEEDEKMLFDAALEKGCDTDQIRQAIERDLHLPTVVVIDDFEVEFEIFAPHLRGIARVVNNAPVESVDAAMLVIQRERPDFVLLDMSLTPNGREGFEILRLIREALPNTKVILDTTSYPVQGPPTDFTREIEAAGFDLIVGKAGWAGTAAYIQSVQAANSP